MKTFDWYIRLALLFLMSHIFFLFFSLSLSAADRRRFLDVFSFSLVFFLRFTAHRTFSSSSSSCRSSHLRTGFLAAVLGHGERTGASERLEPNEKHAK